MICDAEVDTRTDNGAYVVIGLVFVKSIHIKCGREGTRFGVYAETICYWQTTNRYKGTAFKLGSGIVFTGAANTLADKTVAQAMRAL